MLEFSQFQLQQINGLNTSVHGLFEYYTLKRCYKKAQTFFLAWHSLFQIISAHVSNLGNTGLIFLMLGTDQPHPHASVFLDSNSCLTLDLLGLSQS